MANLYDSAYDLENAIRESDEYVELKQSYERLEQDETGKKMFDNFRSLQLTLQEKQMKGEQISEEEAKAAQQQMQVVQQHEGISKLMAAEQKMSVIINDLNRIITKPLEEVYGNPEEAK
ncbi:MAG TPA: YlbF family regulator [Bacillales bacterium]|nr:YlbF family regulator [Bacillales bacterium]